MTDFKKGDRVRWTGARVFPFSSKTHAQYSPDKVGKTGTVTRDVFPSAVNGDWAVNIHFDDGNDTVCFVDNLERVQETKAWPLGARFIFNNPSWPGNPWNGKAGVITGVQSGRMRAVKMDHELADIAQSAAIKYLTPEPKKETKTVSIANIKGRVKGALDSLFSVIVEESAKEQAVRRLGIAAALATRADSEKKAAKAKLKELGVIREDYDASTTETVFDSERYTVEAVTNAGSQRLDASQLELAMQNEGISAAKRIRITRAATVPTKPATSFKVESK